MGKFIDLTGQKFGKLTVVKRTTNPKNNKKDRHSYWLCDCDCGNTVIVVGTSLTSGTTKSCGCIRNDKYIDITGQRFGRLTVIKKVDKPDGLLNRNCYWLCLCDCGNKKIINGRSLRNGSTNSCGCLHKDAQNGVKRTRKNIVEPKYNFYDLSGEYGIGYTHKGEEFYFDLEDYEKIHPYCWHLTPKKYVGNSRLGIRMHRLITNCEDENFVVDHINHIPYDNRKENLRICTLSQNGMNKSKQSNNTSGYTGITYDHYSQKWRVRIGVNNKTVNIGKFISIDEAIKARKEAEEKYFGEYSYDNSIQSQLNGGSL